MPFLLLCCTNSNENNGEGSKKLPPLNSVNVQTNVPIDENTILQLILNRFHTFTKDSVKIQTCSCDINLASITFPRNWTIYEHGGDLAAKPPTGTTETEGEIAIPGLTQIGINYPLSPFDDEDGLNDATQKLYGNLETLPDTTPASIKIAVFDSGLNRNYVSAKFSSETTYLCTPKSTSLDTGKSSTSGWNFVSDRTEQTDTDDGSQVHHGSRVSYMLAKQFIGSNHAPKIIPMRVLGNNKKGDLFSLLCAMETARKNGIKVFNMSLGYYGQAEKIFEKYIKKALKDGVWIVTAAGNRTASEPANVNRDLNSMQLEFYPAAFCKNSQYDKLLVATTVLTTSSGLVTASTRQNYGKDLVLGIKADTTGNNLTEGRFLLDAPDNHDRQTLRIFGTSYAAPVLTGRLALLLSENPSSDRNDLLDQMHTGTGGGQVKGDKYFLSHPPRSRP
ncbi:hypothetical protein GCM10028805_18200 [Spirosoma harenae]